MQMPQGHEGHGYTHEITNEDGEWIWMGGEADMSVIFHNLTGVNFAGRPAKAYADYMEWVRNSTSKAFPGRVDPYANGKVIVLAEIRGQRIASHRFVAAERAAQPSVEAVVASSTAGGATSPAELAKQTFLVLSELAPGHPLRCRTLGELKAECRNKLSKEWRQVARWRIAASTYNDLGASWTETSEFRVPAGTAIEPSRPWTTDQEP